MRLKQASLLLLVLCCFICSCTQDRLLEIHNELDIARSGETVSISLKEAGFSPTSSGSFIIKNQESDEELLSQLVDQDADGIPESLLFQPSLAANESKVYKIEQGTSKLPMPRARTFARFVPERTDDFAWENDRVAFRTYGPEAQRMVEEKIPGGTHSSGIDAWLKKVDYSIINKWYKKDAKPDSSYHVDNGEGLDNYHVGTSRGCGGTGVWLEEKLYSSSNFSGYNVLSNGPIQSSFILKYEDWLAGDNLIQEEKQLSIDLGSNLTQYEVTVKGTETLTVGITLHDRSGKVSLDSINGWFNYTKLHHGSVLSSAIVIDPKYYAGHEVYESSEPDKSHLLVHLKVLNSKVVYHTGFAWKESDQFSDEAAWHAYLSRQARSLKKPLQATLKYH